MIDRKDCFAYARIREEDTCLALNTNTCKKCNFYKTKKQNDRENARTPLITKEDGVVRRLFRRSGFYVQ